MIKKTSKNIFILNKKKKKSMQQILFCMEHGQY